MIFPSHLACIPLALPGRQFCQRCYSPWLFYQVRWCQNPPSTRKVAQAKYRQTGFEPLQEIFMSRMIAQADSRDLLGSSPKGSFEHELLRFMQMNVSSKRRKSRSRSPGQGE